MTIFVGADHRGFELKNKLIDYLHEKNIRVEDLGNYNYDPQDDNPDFAKKVAQAVLQKPSEYLGVVICGSGVGVCITANRYKGIMCGIGINTNQVRLARMHDHINVLAVASDYTDFETAKEIVDVFISTLPLNEQKYLRRIDKMNG